MRMTVTLLLAVQFATTAEAQEPSARARSAQRLSIWGTAIPVAIGSVLWVHQASDAWSSEGSDRTGAALLVAGGLTVGPSLGYSSAGLGGRGMRGVGLRAGFTLLSFGTAYAICGWDCTKGDAAYEVAWLAFATGTGFSLASAIYDIACLPHNVQRHETKQARLSVTPSYAPGQRRFGVDVALSF